MTDPPESFPDAKFFEQVGRLCAAWAFLEEVLQGQIWEILGVSEELGKHITYRLDARQRWELLCELAISGDIKLYEKVKKKNATIRALTAKRNLVVHGLIKWDPVNEKVCWVAYKGKDKGVLKPCSTDFIVQTSQGIVELCHEILEFRGKQELERVHK